MVYGRLEAAAGYLVAITFVDDLWMIEGHLVAITFMDDLWMIEGHLVTITVIDDLWMIEGHLVAITAPTSGDAEGIVAAELTRVARREV